MKVKVSGSSKYYNKTLYIPESDVEIWKRAAKLIPFYLDQSIRQFCSEKIRQAVEKLEARTK